MNEIDLVGSLTRIVAPAKSQTNNTGAFLFDAEAQNFVGIVAVNFNIGVKTAGDSDAVIALRVLHSATNNISNAVNYTPPVASTANAVNVSTSNNTAGSGTLGVDTRSANRYIFYGVALTGTNSLAYPIAVSATGQKKVN